jgi:hypothetical protein
VVGNGRLAIAFGRSSRIKDLFYPRVCLKNHISGHGFRKGI